MKRDKTLETTMEPWKLLNAKKRGQRHVTQQLQTRKADMQKFAGKRAYNV